MDQNLIQVNHSNLPKLREKLLIKQGGRCAILGTYLEEKDAVVDHKHTTKDSILGVNGDGLIRGVLDFRVNSFEGKVKNWHKRLGLSRVVELPTLLRNMADYLDAPPTNFIHPSEKPKSPKLQMASFNMVKRRHMQATGKELSYPRSGKVTNMLRKLFTKYGINPKFYA